MFYSPLFTWWAFRENAVLCELIANKQLRYPNWMMQCIFHCITILATSKYPGPWPDCMLLISFNSSSTVVWHKMDLISLSDDYITEIKDCLFNHRLPSWLPDKWHNLLEIPISSYERRFPVVNWIKDKVRIQHCWILEGIACYLQSTVSNRLSQNIHSDNWKSRNENPWKICLFIGF